MIIDASVGVKWLVLEDETELANRLVDAGDRLIVPELFHAEVGNALWKRVRRAEIEVDVVGELLAGLRSLVETVSEVEIMPRALAIATSIDHPIYDCVYVALAQAAGDVLITADDKFRNKIKRTDLSHHIKALSA